MITGAEVQVKVIGSRRWPRNCGHGCADRRAARWHGHPGLGRQGSNGALTGATCESHGDHRVAMSVAIGALTATQSSDSRYRLH